MSRRNSLETTCRAACVRVLAFGVAAALGLSHAVATTTRVTICLVRADQPREAVDAARLGEFEHPKCLGIQGQRVAIYDAGNQRIVKAVLTD